MSEVGSMFTTDVLPVPVGSRNCSRCLQDFPVFGQERICPKCKAPKPGSKGPELGAPLSRREGQVLELLERGLLNKEIAYELHLSAGTIKQYMNRILAKTGQTNRVQLAVWSFAKRHGIAA